MCYVILFCRKHNTMMELNIYLGITNHDEYSLVRETPEEEVENKANFGTLTLKRRKEDREREKDAKMEQLRKKLKTDDEGDINIYIIILS